MTKLLKSAVGSELFRPFSGTKQHSSSSTAVCFCEGLKLFYFNLEAELDSFLVMLNFPTGEMATNDLLNTEVDVKRSLLQNTLKLGISCSNL